MKSVTGSDHAIKAKGLWALQTLSNVASAAEQRGLRLQLSVVETAMVDDGMPSTILSSLEDGGFRSYDLARSGAVPGAAATGAAELQRRVELVMHRFDVFLKRVGAPCHDDADAPFCFAWRTSGDVKSLSRAEAQRLLLDSSWMRGAAALQPIPITRQVCSALYERRRTLVGTRVAPGASLVGSDPAIDEEVAAAAGGSQDGGREAHEAAARLAKLLQIAHAEGMVGTSSRGVHPWLSQPGGEGQAASSWIVTAGPGAPPLAGLDDRTAKREAGGTRVGASGRASRRRSSAGLERGADSTEGDDSGDELTAAGQGKRCTRVRVLRLLARFARTPDGVLRLTGVADAALQHMQMPAPVRVVMDPALARAQAAEEAVRAADEAEVAFREQLRLGQERGVGLAESFAHFDPTGRGWVDDEALEEGLRQLGLELHPMSMRLLGERFIRNARGRITLKSFLTFAQAATTSQDTGAGLVDSSGGAVGQPPPVAPGVAGERPLPRDGTETLLDARNDASEGIGARDPRELAATVRLPVGGSDAAEGGSTEGGAQAGGSTVEGDDINDAASQARSSSVVRVLQDARREASAGVFAGDEQLAELQAVVRVPYASGDAWQGQSKAARQAALSAHPATVLQGELAEEHAKMTRERRARLAKHSNARSGLGPTKRELGLLGPSEDGRHRDLEGVLVDAMQKLDAEDPDDAFHRSSIGRRNRRLARAAGHQRLDGGGTSRGAVTESKHASRATNSKSRKERSTKGRRGRHALPPGIRPPVPLQEAMPLHPIRPKPDTTVVSVRAKPEEPRGFGIVAPASEGSGGSDLSDEKNRRGGVAGIQRAGSVSNLPSRTPTEAAMAMIARTKDLTKGIELGMQTAWGEGGDSSDWRQAQKYAGPARGRLSKARGNRRRRRGRGAAADLGKSPFAASLPAWARGPSKRNVSETMATLSQSARAHVEEVADEAEKSLQARRRRPGGGRQLARNRREVVRELLDGKHPVATKDRRRRSRMDDELKRVGAEVSQQVEAAQRAEASRQGLGDNDMQPFLVSGRLGDGDRDDSGDTTRLMLTTTNPLPVDARVPAGADALIAYGASPSNARVFMRGVSVDGQPLPRGRAPHAADRLPYQRFRYDEGTELLYHVVRGPEYRVTLDGAIDAKYAEDAPRKSGLGAMYRCVTGAPRYPGGRGASPYASGRPVDLMYVPGMHEDMHGIESQLRSLACKLPGCRVLVMHLPGMAGTTWDEWPDYLDASKAIEEVGSTAERYDALLERQMAARGSESKASSRDRQTAKPGQQKGVGDNPSRKRSYRPLTPRFHSLCLHALVQHLRTTGEWGPKSVQDPRTDAFEKTRGRIGRDVVICASGTSTPVANAYVGEHVCKRSVDQQDRIMASALRCNVLINPFAHVNKSLARVLEGVEDSHAPLAELAKLPQQQPRRSSVASIDSTSPAALKAAVGRRSSAGGRRPSIGGASAATGATDMGSVATRRTARRASVVSKKRIKREVAMRKRLGVTFEQHPYYRPVKESNHDSADESDSSDGGEDEDRNGAAGDADLAAYDFDAAVRRLEQTQSKESSASRQADKEVDWVRSAPDASGLFGGPNGSSHSSSKRGQSAEKLLALRPIRAHAIRQLSRMLLGPSFVSVMGERIALKELFRRNPPLGYGDPFLDDGLAAMARGLRRTRDQRQTLKQLPIPVLVLAGSEDAFVVPLHAYNIARNRGLQGGGSGRVNDEDSGGFNLGEFLQVAGQPPRRSCLSMYLLDNDGASQGAVEGSVSGSPDTSKVDEQGDALDRLEQTQKKLASESGGGVDGGTRVGTAAIRDSDFDLYSSEHVGGGITGTLYPTHVAWLKAGHCLLLERPGFCMRVLEAALVGHNQDRPSTPPPRGSLLTAEERTAIGILGPEDSSVGYLGEKHDGAEPDVSVSQAPRRAYGTEVYGQTTDRFLSDTQVEAAGTRGILKGTRRDTPAGTPFSLAEDDMTWESGQAGQSVRFGSTAGAAQYTQSSVGSAQRHNDFGIAGADEQVKSGTAAGNSSEAQSNEDDPAVARVRAELRARGLSDEGTEFDLLARLEEALDSEMQTAATRTDKARKDRVSRLQKTKRIELEAQARSKESTRQEKQLLGTEAMQAKQAMDRLHRGVENEQEAHERRLMAVEDSIARDVAAQLAARERREQEDKEQQERFAAARASEQESGGQLVVFDPLGDADQAKAFERRRQLRRAMELKSERAVRALEVRQRVGGRMLQLRGEDLGYAMTDAEEEVEVEARAERDRAMGRLESWLAEEEAKEAGSGDSVPEEERGMDRKGRRALKVLRRQARLHDTVLKLAAGSDRLMQHCQQLRFKRRGVVRRWKLLFARQKEQQDQTRRRQREVSACDRALALAQKEKDAVEASLQQGGGNRVLQQQMLQTSSAEIEQLIKYKDEQRAFVDALVDKGKLLQLELEDSTAAAQMLVNSSNAKEGALTRMRIVMSKLVRQRRIARRDAQEKQDSAMQEAAQLVRSLASLKARKQAMRSELSRCKKEKQSMWIDTSIWQRTGQRIRRSELKEYLRRELKKVRNDIGMQTRDLRHNRAVALECDAVLSAAQEDVSMLISRLRRVVECIRAGPSGPLRLPSALEMQASASGASGGGGEQDLLDELEAQVAGGPGTMGSTIGAKQTVPRATPYGPTLSVEDQEQQWTAKYRSSWEEVDLLLHEVQSSGERISEFGAWYAKVKDAPPPVPTDEAAGGGAGGELTAEVQQSLLKASGEEAGDAGPEQSEEEAEQDASMLSRPSTGLMSSTSQALVDRSASAHAETLVGFSRGPQGVPVVVQDQTKVAAATRWKPALDRTLEEKRWVAIDKRMMGQFYGNLTEEDQQAYASDPAYQCHLPRDLLLRIAALPCSPGIASAFISTEAQMEAHGLITKFTLGQGEDREHFLDQLSGARAMAMAAVARGFVARSKMPRFRSEEEKEWVAADRVLRPHLYIGEENEPGEDRESDAGEPGTDVSGPAVNMVREGIQDFVESGGPLILEVANSDDETEGAKNLVEGDGDGISDSGSEEDGLHASGAAAADGTKGAARRRSESGQQVLSGGTRRPTGRAMFKRLSNFKEKQDLQAEAAKRKLARSKKRKAAFEFFEATDEAQGRGNIAEQTFSSIDDVRRREFLMRPPGGAPLAYSREQLLELLRTPPGQLKSKSEQRLQMLLMAYGSDGGRAIFEMASRCHYAVVRGLAEVAEAMQAVQERRLPLQLADYAEEMCIADADGSRLNVAAVAMQACQGLVLVRSRHSATLLSVHGATVEAGQVAEHSFVVPGSIADCVGHGPRGWGGSRGNATARRGYGHQGIRSVFGVSLDEVPAEHAASLIEAAAAAGVHGTNGARAEGSQTAMPAWQGSINAGLSMASGTTPFADTDEVPGLGRVTWAENSVNRQQQRSALARLELARTKALEGLGLPVSRSRRREEMQRKVAEQEAAIEEAKRVSPAGWVQSSVASARGESADAANAVDRTGSSTSERDKFDRDVQNASRVRGFLRPSDMDGTGLAALQAARPIGSTGDKLKEMARQAGSRPAEAGVGATSGAVNALHITGSAPSGQDTARNSSMDAPRATTAEEQPLAMPTSALEDARWEKQRLAEEAQRSARERAGTPGTHDSAAPSQGFGQGTPEEEDGEEVDPALRPRTRYEHETGVPGVLPQALDISVTITFHGEFLRTEYVPARLQGVLYREPMCGEVATDLREPVAYLGEDHADELDKMHGDSILIRQGNPMEDMPGGPAAVYTARQRGRPPVHPNMSSHLAPSAQSSQAERGSAVKTPRERHARLEVPPQERLAGQMWPKLRMGGPVSVGVVPLSGEATQLLRAVAGPSNHETKAYDPSKGAQGASVLDASSQGPDWGGAASRAQASSAQHGLALAARKAGPAELGVANGQLGASNQISSSAVYTGPRVDVAGTSLHDLQVSGARTGSIATTIVTPEQLPPLARPVPRLPGVPSDQVVAQMRCPVGWSSWQECKPNTTGSIGRLVIRHRPLTLPVMPGKYTVVLKGVTKANYSVTVSCRLAYAARDVVEGCVLSSDKKERRLPASRKELESIASSYRLGARKRHIVRQLINQVNRRMTANVQQQSSLREALDKGRVLVRDLGSDDEADSSSDESDSSDDGLRARADSDASSDTSSIASGSSAGTSDSGSSRGSSGTGSDASSAASGSTGSSGSSGSGSSSGSDATGSGAGSQSGKPLTAEDVRRKIEMNRIKQERRRMQLADVTESMRGRIVRRIQKLEERFATLARSLGTRSDEMRQIEEGLMVLREARHDRQAEVEALVSGIREFRRYVPAAAAALRIDASGSVAMRKERRRAAMERLGLTELLGRAPASSIEEQVQETVSRSQSIASGKRSSQGGKSLGGLAAAEQATLQQQSKGDARALVLAHTTQGQLAVQQQNRDDILERLRPSPSDVEYVRLGPCVMQYLVRQDESTMSNPAVTPAMVVRRKPISELTYEEAVWLAMDRVMHPEEHELDDQGQAEDDELAGLVMLAPPNGESLSAGPVRRPQSRQPTQAGGLDQKPRGILARIQRDKAAKGKAKIAQDAIQQLDSVYDAGGGPPPVPKDEAISEGQGGDGPASGAGASPDAAPQARTKDELNPVEPAVVGGAKGQGLRGTAADLYGQANQGRISKEGRLAGATSSAEADSGGAAGSAAPSSRTEARRDMKLVGRNPSANAPVQVLDPHLQTSTTLTGHLGAIRLLEVTGGQMPPCPFSRVELRRILTAPVTTLAPVEREARDLLNKYHDRPPPRAEDATLGLQQGPQGRRLGSAASSRVNLRTPKTAAITTRQQAAGGTAGAILPYGQPQGGGEHPDGVVLTPAQEAIRQRNLQLESRQSEQRSDGGAGMQYHRAGPEFAVVRSAVPIPRHAPAKLKHLLAVRAVALTTRWEAFLEKHRSETSKTDTKGRKLQGGAAWGGSTEVQGINVMELSDVDQRARDLLDELDRANGCAKPTMDSAVLYGVEQRYQTITLRAELEKELDLVLQRQVLEREQVETALQLEIADTNAAKIKKRAEQQAKRLEAARAEVLKQMKDEDEGRVKAVAGELEAMNSTSGGLLSDDERARNEGIQIAIARAKAERAKLRGHDASLAMEEKEVENRAKAEERAIKEQLALDLAGVRGGAQEDEQDPIQEIGGLAKWGAPDKPLTPRRAREMRIRKREQAEEQRLQEQLMEDGDEMDSQQRAMVRGKLKTIRDRRRAQAQTMLRKRKEGADGGAGGNGSEGTPHDDDEEEESKRVVLPPWQSTEDVVGLKARQEELEQELLRVRTLPEEIEVVETHVLLSVLRGGRARVTVQDAIMELATEVQDVRNRLRLVDLDRELHAAYSSKEASIETTAMHGYKQTAWRLDAIAALERDSNRIVARQVALGLVDDILEWMLEGWYFGERESAAAVSGFVPSLQKDRPLRPYESASTAAQQYKMQGAAAQAQAMDAARGLAPAIGDPMGNAKAAATLQDLDPSGRIFPVARAGDALAIANSLRVQEEQDGFEGGRPDTSWARITTAEAGDRGRAAGAGGPGMLAIEDGDASGGGAARMGSGSTAGGQLVPAGGSGANAGAMVPYGSRSGGRGGSRGQLVGRVTSMPGGDGRAPLRFRWGVLQATVDARDSLRRAISKRQEVDITMRRAERTLKFAMFLYSLVYFRAMTQLRKQKDVWSGAKDAALVAGARRTVKVTAERRRMDEVDKARQLREDRLQKFEQLAARGFAARAQRATQERKEAAAKRTKQQKLRRARIEAAKSLQRAFRGYRARGLAFVLARKRRQEVAEKARLRAAATAIQAVFRSHLAQKVLVERRRELTAFVRLLRRQEQQEMEEEYYRNNPLERFKRDVTDFFKTRGEAKAKADQQAARPLRVEGDERRDEEELGEGDPVAQDGGAPLDVKALGNDSKYFALRRQYSPVVIGKGPVNTQYRAGGAYRDVAERLMDMMTRSKAQAKQKGAADMAALARSQAGLGDPDDSDSDGGAGPDLGKGTGAGGAAAGGGY